MEVLTRTFHYNWTWRLDAEAEALWPLVADTNRFNEAAGVPPVEGEDDFCTIGQGKRMLSLRRFGVRVSWEEEAFQWVRPHYFSVMRRYTAGPVATMDATVRLEPLNDGATLLHYDVTAVPSNALGIIAIPMQIGLISKRQFGSIFQKYGRQPAPPRSNVMLAAPVLGPVRKLAAGAADRLDSAGTRLTAAGRFATHWPRLREVIERADDVDVDRMRPYLFADAWDAPRRDILQLCLEATRLGILQLRWDLMCPLCRGTKGTAETLSDLELHAYCACCHADVSADFDRAVELSFKPTDAVRPLDIAAYCVGGPQVTPHVAVQQLLAADESRVVNVTLDEGRYRVRTLELAGCRLLNVVRGGPAVVELAPSDTGWSGEDADVASTVSMTLRNASAAPQLFIVERLAWSDQSVVAADVFALQSFRDLFAAEALRPGERVTVGSTTVLFTDLRESTALYLRVGDAPAFGTVLDHFTALRSALEHEDGAIVKTIGDAVMAVFRQPAGAVRAVLRAHELLASHPDGIQPHQLKAGVHFGPCIAVTLNQRLDYFGSTVNVAARLEAQSEGGDVVVSEELFRDAEVTALVEKLGLTVVPAEVLLKGYTTPTRFYKLRMPNVRWSRC